MDVVKNIYMLGHPIELLDFDGRTPLHIAASEGHLDIVEFLIAKGIDITVEDSRGNNAR